MARICNNLAKKTNDFEEAEKNLAYGVFLVEKKFNVGPIDENFLAMKFFNLLDEENGKMYKESISGKSGGTTYENTVTIG